MKNKIEFQTQRPVDDVGGVEGAREFASYIDDLAHEVQRFARIRNLSAVLAALYDEIEGSIGVLGNVLSRYKFVADVTWANIALAIYQVDKIRGRLGQLFALNIMTEHRDDMAHTIVTAHGQEGLKVVTQAYLHCAMSLTDVFAVFYELAEATGVHHSLTTPTFLDCVREVINP